jgi:type IV pilus assembly protein PilE
MRTSQRGFTLIEMLIATTIAGILASLALPSFTAPMNKARRSDGIAALMQLQMSQEQWRSNHSSYASLAELRSAATSHLRYYTLEVSDAGAAGYSLTATATGAQSGDQACRVLRLTMAHGQATHASGTDERAANTPAANKSCWGF